MTDQRRGLNVSIIGMSLQTLVAITILIIWRWSESLAAMSALWLVATGIPLWVLVAVIFYCRELASREQIDLEEIARHGGKDNALFDRAADIEQQPAARRVAWIDKFVVPIFTLMWAGTHVVVATFMLRYLDRTGSVELVSPSQNVLFLIVAGFVTFLFSYYSLGMARVQTWRLLRPTGSFLLINTLGIGACIAAMVFAWQGYMSLDRVVAWIIPAIQVVLACELGLNFILDIYRPRVPGQEHRYSFDSRLLNIIAEPSRVGHGLAETLNYQFGFEVSKTWFYQLLRKSLVPLILVGVVILVLISSLVIVPEGKYALVRHWGKLDRHRVMGPGMHICHPWPVDTVHMFEVGTVREVLLGVGNERSELERQSDFVNDREVFLWTAEHGTHRELDFIIAVPPTHTHTTRGDQAPPPVNIIKLVVSVQYKVRPDGMKDYGYNYVDPHRMIENLAYREVTRYCASATLDSAVSEDQQGERPEAIMTFGRRNAERELMRRVQDAVSKAGLGVDVSFVGLWAVHPPAEAADEFENVLKAERAMDQKRFEAEGEAVKLLTEVAGDPIDALRLALAIRKLDEFEELKRLMNSTDEFTRRHEGFIRNAIENIQVLNEEIERERLMGKVAPIGNDPVRQLAVRQMNHLGDLLSIRQQALSQEVDLSVLLEAASQEAAMRVAANLADPAGGELVKFASRRYEELKTLDSLKEDRANLSQAIERFIASVADDLSRDEVDAAQRKAGGRGLLRHEFVEYLGELMSIPRDSSRQQMDFAARIDVAQQQVDELFKSASGEPASILAQANAYRLSKELEERARYDAMAYESLAYHASPNVYMLDRWLAVWDEVLPGIHKYVLAVPRDKLEVWLNWHRDPAGLEQADFKRAD